MEAFAGLEFGRIGAALRDRTQTQLGALRADAIGPLPHRSDALAQIEAIRQMRTLIAQGVPPPVAGGADVAVALEQAEKGLVLEVESLRAVASTMGAGNRLRRHLLPRELEVPALYGLAVQLEDLTRTTQDIERCFDRDGQLADDASPDLGPLRKRVRGLQQNLRERLGELLHQPEMQSRLMESYYTVRGDRFVLPVKASFKNEVKGIVHDASGSGQTVFIEPQALVDLGNRLKIAQSDAREEEIRILSFLSAEVAKVAPSVRRTMEAVGHVDFLIAAARLAEDLHASPIKPDVRAGFEIMRARHPLLVLAAHAAAAAGETSPSVVANDLALKDGQHALLFTGPNTGGKTVAMKTIGLLALMVRAGLHVPCGEHSRIGWYTRFAVVIGDQQSIASQLSTFSAHLKALVSALQRAGPSTLVLVDEIAADTDPSQGQALAQAFLERLADKGAHIVATTHFESLKVLAFQDERFRNAGVGFDPDRLAPTYEVTLDVPQGSSALDIAQSLGVVPTVIERARALVDPGQSNIQAMLVRLDDQLQSLRTAEAQAAEQARAAQKAEAEAERQQRRLAREIELVQERAQEGLLEEVESARRRVKSLLRELDGLESSGTGEELVKAANAAARELKSMADRPTVAKEETPPPPAPDFAVKRGDWVHVPRVGQDGAVQSVDGRDAQVLVGNVRIRARVKDLRPAKRRPPKGAGEHARRKRMERPVAPPVDKKVDIWERLDLRGATVDEAIDRLDGFLDHHYAAPTTHIRIVHGVGSGALRQALRSHLRASGYVKHCGPDDSDDGADAATVVELA